MHGYYYDQNRVYPEETPGPKRRRRKNRRRRPGKAALLFCGALVLLLLAAAGLRWMGDALPPVPGWETPSQEGGQQSGEKRGETTVERAPTGGDFTMTLVPQPQAEPHTLQTIYQENIQSIVSIWGDAGSSYSYGTGVVLSSDGYIITNAHVIEGCSQVEVVLQDDRSFEALLVGMDLPTDLAVLKVEAEDLTPAAFGDSGQLQVGDAVAAIGNPLGQELRGTMTDGIISAINRDVDVDGYSMVLIQTTAAYDDTVEGLGFAIPTTTAKKVVDDLVRQGYVSGAPTIGITCYTVTEEMQENYGLPAGVCVKSVQQGTDAETQGIFPGDVIVAANGQPVTTIEELLALKDTLSAGDVIHIRLWRNGAELERDATLTEQYIPEK